MTVQEAYDALGSLIESGCGDKQLVIPIKFKHSIFGGTPSMPVKGIINGFDWNQKRVFIHPLEDLGKIED